MSSSAIVQKLWNSACLFSVGADKYCNVHPAWSLPDRQAGAGGRDEGTGQGARGGRVQERTMGPIRPRR
jgi:hypothetical protein